MQKDVSEYIQKINLMETMLNEIKQGLFTFDQEFQESIQKGEQNIVDGNVTTCKTEKELDDFFESI